VEKERQEGCQVPGKRKYRLPPYHFTTTHPLGYHGRGPRDTTEPPSALYSLNPARNRAMPARFQVFGTKPPPTSRVTNAQTHDPRHPRHLISTTPAPSPIGPHHHSERCARNRTPAGRFRVFFAKPAAAACAIESTTPPPPPSHTHHPTTFTHRLPPLFPTVRPKPSPSGSVLVFFLQYPPMPPARSNLPFHHHHHRIPTTPPPPPTTVFNGAPESELHRLGIRSLFAMPAAAACVIEPTISPPPPSHMHHLTTFHHCLP
jgi:hypothetical protein